MTRLHAKEKVVALTFDDGPSPDTTPLVLDILRASGVTATFFVLGDAVERHPDLLRRIVRDGHQIGLHGYEHRALIRCKPLRAPVRTPARVAANATYFEAWL